VGTKKNNLIANWLKKMVFKVGTGLWLGGHGPKTPLPKRAAKVVTKMKAKRKKEPRVGKHAKWESSRGGLKRQG